MDVGRTDGVGGPNRVEGPRKTPKVTPSQTPSAPPPTDKVEISEAARLVSEALSLPQVRTERVEEIKKLLESGQFDNDARLQGAIDQFLEENSDLTS